MNVNETHKNVKMCWFSLQGEVFFDARLSHEERMAQESMNWNSRNAQEGPIYEGGKTHVCSTL